MADPTFDGVALCTRAGRCELRSARVRAWTDTLPGVDGAFVQLAGRGARTILVTGLLSAEGAAAPAARAALLAALRQRGDLADGATVADLVGTDGHRYDDCLLMRYDHGPVRISRAAADAFTALASVRAELLQVAP